MAFVPVRPMAHRPLLLVACLLASSGLVVPAGATAPHAPILVVGDADLLAQAAAEGWTGSGSPTDPIVIAGYAIAAPADGITLRSITLSVAIRDNEVTTPGATAITLDSVPAATVEANTFSGRTGLLVRSSPGVLARGNACDTADKCIHVQSSTGVQVVDNVFGRVLIDGLTLHSSNDATVAGNTFFDVGAAAVYSLYGSGLALTGNTMERVQSGIIVYGGSADIAGNTFRAATVAVNGRFAAQLDVHDNTVDGAQQAVVAQDSSGALVHDNTFTGGRDGIQFTGYIVGSVLRNSFADLSGTGVRVRDRTDAVPVEDNVFATVSGAAVSIDGGSGHTLRRNLVDRSGGAYALNLVNAGLGVVSDNAVTRSVGGIQVSGAYLGQKSPTITNNRVEASANGILVGSNDALIAGNEATAWGGSASGVGLTVSGRGNVADRNRVAGFATGIQASTQSAFHLVTNNTVTGGGTGILASGISILVQNNTISGAVYGIRVFGGSHVVRANTVTGSSTGLLLSGTATTTSRAAANNLVEKNHLTALVYGVLLRNTDGNRLLTNWLTGSKYGIGIDTAKQNQLYNNYFDNANNVRHLTSDVNTWTAPSSGGGPNIVGGDKMGGNYWSDYVGHDVDGDGLGDSPYTMGGALDRAPLVPT